MSDDLYKLIYWFTGIAYFLFVTLIIGWTLFIIVPDYIAIDIILPVVWGGILLILLLRDYRNFFTSF